MTLIMNKEQREAEALKTADIIAEAHRLFTVMAELSTLDPKTKGVKDKLTEVDAILSTIKL